MNADILIVDDEADIRSLIQGILEDEGYTTREAANATEAYERIATSVPSLVILDIWLKNSQHDGIEILTQIKEEHPDIPVLMISGHGTIETAVSAIKQGAYDFIEKPFKSDRLLLMIERALETAMLREENQSLRKKTQGPSKLIGDSPAMLGLRQLLERVAQTNSRVLITGEPGTGKETAARALHRLSPRAEKPFVTLNCATMRPEHLEAELFGSEENADRHKGLLEQADGGTLLLHEVVDMPLETQGKIVRVLQEQRFLRLGGQREIEVDIRIIASTNRDLLPAIEQGTFRQDLYYRLNVVPIEIPPLRDRVADILLLSEYFIESFSKESGMPSCKFSESALAVMQGYSWPGNVRQLCNTVEWVMIMNATSGDNVITTEQLPPEVSAVCLQTTETPSGEDLMALSLKKSREVFEKEYLEFQLKRFGSNISKTARFIEMERSALHRKLKLLGISSQPQHNSDDSEAIQDNLKRA